MTLRYVGKSRLFRELREPGNCTKHFDYESKKSGKDFCQDTTTPLEETQHLCARRERIKGEDSFFFFFFDDHKHLAKVVKFTERKNKF